MAEVDRKRLEVAMLETDLQMFKPGKYWCHSRLCSRPGQPALCTSSQQVLLPCSAAGRTSLKARAGAQTGRGCATARTWLRMAASLRMSSYVVMTTCASAAQGESMHHGEAGCHTGPAQACSCCNMPRDTELCPAESGQTAVQHAGCITSNLYCRMVPWRLVALNS